MNVHKIMTEWKRESGQQFGLPVLVTEVNLTVGSAR